MILLVLSIATLSELSFVVLLMIQIVKTSLYVRAKAREFYHNYLILWLMLFHAAFVIPRGLAWFRNPFPLSLTDDFLYGVRLFFLFPLYLLCLNCYNKNTMIDKRCWWRRMLWLLLSVYPVLFSWQRIYTIFACVGLQGWLLLLC